MSEFLCEGFDVRNLKAGEFLEHFIDAPIGSTHNSKPRGSGYLCYAFSFIALNNIQLI